MADFVVDGCRGSMSVSGPAYVRHGGNTSCFSVEIEPGHHLVLDGGTGLRNLERRLGPGPQRFTFFLTHYHWDHLQGLPVFGPLYDPGSTIVFWGAASEARNPNGKILKRELRKQFADLTY